MGITLIVTRAHDRSFEETGRSISPEEWLAYVHQDPELRLRTEDWVAVNPITQERITMPAGEAETWFRVVEEDHPFLRYRSGNLVMKYSYHLDDPENPARRKIAAIARHFSALITHDAGDEILDWEV